MKKSLDAPSGAASTGAGGPRCPTTHRLRAVGIVAAGLAAALIATGCSNPIPNGTVRYRTGLFPAYTTDRNIQYGTAAGSALKLDLYRPQGDTVTRRPAVVWAHGGAFIAGDKASDPATTLAQDFAKMGYVTVSINYRLITGTICTGFAITEQCRKAVIDSAHDAQAAVRWLRANATTYGIDPDRIAMGGASAGAVLATAVGVAADDPGTSGNPGFPSDVRAWMALSGGLPKADIDERADAGDAPGLMFTGTADFIVPHQWSLDTAAALNRVGVEAQVVSYQGAGHMPMKADLRPKTIDFFYKHLDLANAAR
jgi:dipeptidyl aminopeptidase/acylaminoacyl peptidase